MSLGVMPSFWRYVESLFSSVTRCPPAEWPTRIIFFGSPLCRAMLPFVHATARAVSARNDSVHYLVVTNPNDRTEGLARVPCISAFAPLLAIHYRGLVATCPVTRWSR